MELLLPMGHVISLLALPRMSIYSASLELSLRAKCERERFEGVLAGVRPSNSPHRYASREDREMLIQQQLTVVG